MTGYYSCRIAPFGHLGINARLQLPQAFRSLPRPSSAPSAKAFTLCSCSLDHYVIFWFSFSAIVVFVTQYFNKIFDYLITLLLSQLFIVQFSMCSAYLIVSLVGSNGLEPSTSRLSGVRSNHLSYEPMQSVAFPLLPAPGHFHKKVVEMRRIELLTPCLQGRCSPS